MKNKNTKRVFAAFTAVILAFALAVPTVAVESRAAVGNIKELIPGGMAFGVKFFTEGLVVLGTTGVETASGVVSPSKDAGLHSGDIILRAGGTELNSASKLTELVAGCGGKPIIIAYSRNGNENTVNVTPVRDMESGEYKIGVFVRDSTAGIGTVTYIDPETMDFGGLGHGIYESETGVLLPLHRGAVVDVDIIGVVKSVRNDPGQLRGNFGRVSVGELWDNSEQGVFGRFRTVPVTAGKPIPVASKEEVREGDAYILTTLSDHQTESYGIEIEKIYDNSGRVKNFLIKVTDEDLLEQTGGIVQGMSGSPIIQDGKLIGAVTHVLVNDPVHGYGIFIENMLNAAK
ncbi:MAG: SpoIVB peptidase [Ruminococcaceae bacterium]|nr:SpoIVB peptidase [Oscillospiraceae bacterium]